ncbi:hypothetical protein EDB89DRAFT_2077867 [Lactarius sanguifluus]|nr:hypothetical protein EDB89DRAFT_2077867 [Lactarius sanguifluus]
MSGRHGSLLFPSLRYSSKKWAHHCFENIEIDSCRPDTRSTCRAAIASALAIDETGRDFDRKLRNLRPARHRSFGAHPARLIDAIELGGLGLTPVDIGLCMSAYGCVSAGFQLAFFPRVVVATAVAFGLLYALFQFCEHLVAISVSDMAFSCSVSPDCGLALTALFEGLVFMLVSSTTLNKRSLGAPNGLLQTVVSTQRAVGPAAAASLFAFSLQNNVLGGQLAYAVLLSLHVSGCVWPYNFRGILGSLRSV